MLFVDREGVKPPPSLEDQDGAGKKEFTKAAEHYKKRGKESFPFEAYKGGDVIKALEQLFRGKCAYCEDLYAAGAPVDVEHYRPKAAIKGEAAHRGYWWLACEWSNLLPSCIDCNRSRYHDRVQGAPEFDDGQAPLEVLYGKGNEFPIDGRRAKRPSDDLEDEDALLIDPTRRDPSDHIAWEWTEGPYFAKPTWNEKAGAADKYGMASIRTFGLNRRVLIEERAAIAMTIKAYEKTLTSRIRRAASAAGEDLEEVLEEIINDLCTLRKSGEPSRPYSASAKTLIDDLLLKINGRLKQALANLPGGGRAGG